MPSLPKVFPSQKKESNESNSRETSPENGNNEQQKQQTDPPDPGPPPDGGGWAWTQAAVGHLAGLNTFGFMVSFGIFQQYYAEILGHPLSDISWIGSLQIFFLYFVGALSGRLLDAGYYRELFYTGCFLQVLGVMMVSLAKTYWQFICAQSLAYGIGAGLVFCPMCGLVSTWFSTRRAFALGIVGAGGGTGGLVYPAIARQLQPKIGFPWTVRVMGFVMLGSFIVMLTFVRSRMPPRKSGPMIDWTAFKDARYTLFSVGMFFAFWCQFMAYYYIGLYAQNIQHVNTQTSLSLILILNAFGLIGRLVPSFIADTRIGVLGILTPVMFIAGLCMFLWGTVDSEPKLYAFAVFYGFFSGGVQNLFPVTVSRIMTDLDKIGTRIGMSFAIASIACLTGPPLAGAWVSEDHGQYLHMQMFGGASMVLGSFFLVGCHLVWHGFKWPWNCQN